MKKIYIVLSNNYTLIGGLISLRQKMHFGIKDRGSKYSHVSISLDDKLDKMVSFARKKIYNPFDAGLITEDLSHGMFKVKSKKSIIAVISISISVEKYMNLCKIIKKYLSNKNNYKYNINGLIRIIIHGRDSSEMTNCKHYFCSEWVNSILVESGLDYFGKDFFTVTPADFYHKFEKFITYEGLTKEYYRYARTDDSSNILYTP